MIALFAGAAVGVYLAPEAILPAAGASLLLLLRFPLQHPIPLLFFGMALGCARSGPEIFLPDLPLSLLEQSFIFFR